MDSISLARSFSTGCYELPLPPNPLKSHSRTGPLHAISSRTVSVSALRAALSLSVADVVEEDVLRMYLKEREENGDFILSVSHNIWLKDVMKVMDMGLGSDQAEAQQDGDEDAAGSQYDDNGFLKLAPTQEWLLSERSAPYYKKARARAMQDNSDRRKKLNLLKYEALAWSAKEGTAATISRNRKIMQWILLGSFLCSCCYQLCYWRPSQLFVPSTYIQIH